MPRARKKFMTMKLVAALDRCKISDRNAVHILIATLEALGHDPLHFVLNRTSIREVRMKLREKYGQDIQNNLDTSVMSGAVLHWDGKLLPSLSGKSKVERLPIIISGNGFEKLLGVPSLNSGTGHDQANAVYECTSKWNLCDKVEAICCDTTSSNTGRLNGANILLEQLLEKDLLYFMCRHHILELILKSVFESKMGPSTGPSVSIFKRFQDAWPTINTENFVSGTTNIQVRNDLKDVIIDISKFIEKTLEEKHPREDYRELLELVLIFLNIKPNRGIFFRAPGAIHHARWMAKALYSIKIYIFKDQFQLTSAEEKSLRSICIFIIRVYVKAWFCAPNAAMAPFQDLELVKTLIRYSSIDEIISQNALKKICNHLWYLVPETASLSFFDENISILTKQKMVAATNNKNNMKYLKKININLKDIDCFLNKNIEDFITESSLNFFERFGINKNFLLENPEIWPTLPEYIQGKEIVKNIRVVNDAAERAVKLMTEFNEILTKDEDQKQYLLAVVTEYRKQFPDSNKQTLINKLATFT